MLVATTLELNRARTVSHGACLAERISAEQQKLCCTQAVAIAEKALGPDHPNVAASLENLAAVYRATKRDEEAETLEQRASRIRAIQR